jgi:Bacterial regulatory helix-turn-helix protein, lysR family
MNDIHLSIHIDCASGFRIGPGKIALLEAIRSTGSITAAAKSVGMSYRRAWLLLDEFNHALRKPAVATKHGGSEAAAPRSRPWENRSSICITRSNYMPEQTWVQSAVQSENWSAKDDELKNTPTVRPEIAFSCGRRSALARHSTDGQGPTAWRKKASLRP